MKKIIFYLILFLFSYVVDIYAFSKTVSEEFYRYHEFRRADGNGWLADGETIGTQLTDVSVKCYDRETLSDTSSSMIANVSVTNGNATRSRVQYQIKAGIAGKVYLMVITIKTSAGQTFVDWLDLSVN